MKSSQSIRKPLVVHRCYMTGQKCVYLRSLLSQNAHGAFLICPFSEDYDYNWRYHFSKLNLASTKLGGEVHRADSVGKTGYVMCSRICHPIQRSALIIADITEPNLNVFYELGLACALEKPILMIAQEDRLPGEIERFIERIGLSPHLEKYGNDVSKITVDTLLASTPALDFSKRNDTNDNKRSREKVILFSNEGAEYLLKNEGARPSNRRTKLEKILGHVLNTLKEEGNVNLLMDRCKSILKESGDSDRSVLITKDFIGKILADLSSGIYATYDTDGRRPIGPTIKNASCIVIDTTLNDFASFFWLGLCHGLEKDVVPLSLSDEVHPSSLPPFDIRTLWHVWGDLKNMEFIEDQISQILIEIIANQTAAQAVRVRNSFWANLINTNKLSFYLGTEQSSELASKQVIGEWDTRTFQEFTSLASRLNPNLDNVLEKPAFKREDYDPDDKNRFFEFLQQRIGDSHCFLIGSPDVNPVVEVALSRLKGVPEFSKWQKQLKAYSRLKRNTLTGNSSRAIFEGYIPFKNYTPQRYKPKNISFFAQLDSTDPVRGFLYYGEDGRNPKRLERKYIPREKFAENESGDNGEAYGQWELLGHMVIAPNPFSSDYPDTTNKVLLFMGVGGPATLGLAYLVTGRLPVSQFHPWKDDRKRIEDFFLQSDSFIQSMISILDEKNSAEAIIGINVENSYASRNSEFEDSRDISKVYFQDAMLQGVRNPKEFLYQKKAAM